MWTLTEQSACDDCTQPESSFLIQQAVSRSFNRILSTSCVILSSTRIHGANFAPKCIKSAAFGPNLIEKEQTNRKIKQTFPMCNKKLPKIRRLHNIHLL